MTKDILIVKEYRYQSMEKYLNSKKKKYPVFERFRDEYLSIVKTKWNEESILETTNEIDRETLQMCSGAVCGAIENKNHEQLKYILKVLNDVKITILNETIGLNCDTCEHLDTSDVLGIDSYCTNEKSPFVGLLIAYEWATKHRRCSYHSHLSFDKCGPAFQI